MGASNAPAGATYVPPVEPQFTDYTSIDYTPVPYAPPLDTSAVIPEVTGTLPTEVLTFSASAAACKLLSDIVLGVGAGTETDKSSGLSGVVSAYYSDPYVFDDGFAFSPGGVDYMPSIGSAGYAGATNRQSLSGLFGAGATAVKSAHGSHMVNGWGMALGNNGHYATTGDKWQTCTTRSGSYSEFAICPHDTNHLIAVRTSGDYFYFDKSVDGGATFTTIGNLQGHIVGGGSWWVTLQIPYSRHDGSANTDDSGLEIMIAVGNQNGGSTLAYIGWFALGDLATLQALPSAGWRSSALYHNLNLSGGFWFYSNVSPFSVHTWDGQRVIQMKFVYPNAAWSVVTDDGVTVAHDVYTGIHGAGTTAEVMGFEGWPSVGTDDPDVGYWIAFGMTVGSGGLAVSGDNGGSWTSILPSGWSAASYAEWRASYRFAIVA